MDLPIEAWAVIAAVAALGIGAMLLSMAAAIRHGVSIIELEARVRHLRAQHRLQLIARGLIEPEEGELIEVEIIDDDEPIEAVPIDDEPAGTERRAA